MISASVCAGCVAANRLHIGPPSDTPSSTACRDPTASSTARTSSMRCSRVGRCVTGSDSPVPRLSNRISRENEARRLQEPRERRFLPEVLEVRHPSHHEDEVDRSAAADLIRDVDVAAPRVLDRSGQDRGGIGDRRRTRSRGGGRLRDAGDEPVAAPVRRLDEAWRLRVVAERAPDFADADLQRAVGHERIRPERVEQLGLLDQAARPRREILEQRQRLGRQGDGARLSVELSAGGIEPETIEGEERVRRHGAGEPERVAIVSDLSPSRSLSATARSRRSETGRYSRARGPFVSYR